MKGVVVVPQHSFQSTAPQECLVLFHPHARAVIEVPVVVCVKRDFMVSASGHFFAGYEHGMIWIGVPIPANYGPEMKRGCQYLCSFEPRGESGPTSVFLKYRLIEASKGLRGTANSQHFREELSLMAFRWLSISGHHVELALRQLICRMYCLYIEP